MSNLNKYQEIQEFYSKTEFPGRYTADDLSYYDNGIHNVYLQGIDKHLPVTGQVLDIGAGSGLITNLFAKRRLDCVFTSIDISQSILYGRQFSIDNNINNTAWIQEIF